MALWVPRSGFVTVQHNLDATPSTTIGGTTIACAATANTKGNFSDGQLISSTTYDTYLIVLMWHSTGTANTDTSMLLDIGVGPSGTETTIISNLLVGWRNGLVGTHSAGSIYLPIFIPAGSRVSARAQGAILSDTVELHIWLYQGASQLPWRTYAGVDAYGVDTSTSRGTSHTPGNSGAESSWASVGSTTSRNYDALFFLTQGLAGVDTVMANAGYHWEIGYGSTNFLEFYEASSSTEVIAGPYPGFPIPCSIPSGTQLQVRGECSTTAEARDIAIYGLY